MDKFASPNVSFIEVPLYFILNTQSRQYKAEESKKRENKILSAPPVYQLQVMYYNMLGMFKFIGDNVQNIVICNILF